MTGLAAQLLFDTTYENGSYSPYVKELNDMAERLLKIKVSLLNAELLDWLDQ